MAGIEQVLEFCEMRNKEALSCERTKQQHTLHVSQRVLLMCV